MTSRTKPSCSIAATALSCCSARARCAVAAGVADSVSATSCVTALDDRRSPESACCSFVLRGFHLQVSMCRRQPQHHFAPVPDDEARSAAPVRALCRSSGAVPAVDSSRNLHGSPSSRAESAGRRQWAPFRSMSQPALPRCDDSPRVSERGVPNAVTGTDPKRKRLPFSVDDTLRAEGKQPQRRDKSSVVVWRQWHLLPAMKHDLISQLQQLGIDSRCVRDQAPRLADLRRLPPVPSGRSGCR